MDEHPRPSLHIVFSASAAGSVAQALRAAGFDDRVMCVAADLSCGPIDDIQGDSRRAWIAEHLDWTYADVHDVSARSWAVATSSPMRRVAWVTRRDAREFSNYLEFVSRMGDVAFDLVDVPRVEVPRANGDGSFPLTHLALLGPKDIAAARLWSYRRPAEPHQVESDRALWRKLRAENAPLRVMRDGSLVSAPLVYFDAVIRACASGAWQTGARVVGEAMALLAAREQWIGDAFLWGRVRALARAGALEIIGDLSEMFAAQVRGG